YRELGERGISREAATHCSLGFSPKVLRQNTDRDSRERTQRSQKQALRQFPFRSIAPTFLQLFLSYLCAYRL
ncbi:MAG TPA: hypothetical protein VE641_10270, partial [Chthoniobacterales bacterium]|nr:hypothetical protein [Chthoniobacterales bacterium]